MNEDVQKTTGGIPADADDLEKASIDTVYQKLETSAKGLTSAYAPLAATIISDAFYDVISVPQAEGAMFTHGFTYSGHPVCCAAGLKNIEIMEREDICGHVREVGPYLEEQLDTLRDLPIVGDVRGSHFMMCVENVADKETKALFAPEVQIGNRIAEACEARGVLVRPIAHLNVLSPPLILTRDQIETSGTIALCKFRRMMLLTPRWVLRGYPWAETLAHEYTHYVLWKRNGPTVPIWLHEGVARYEEVRWTGAPGAELTPFMMDVLAEGLRTDRLVTFDEMHPSFAMIDDPRKVWKLSPMDEESFKRWYDYSRARDDMLAATSADYAPWHLVRADIKKHARLNCIAHLLSLIPYEDLTPEPIELPHRAPDTGYIRPPITDQTFVPEIYP